MTSNIEGLGVSAVNSLIFSSTILTPYLTWNDKTISWDGTIFVYKNNKAKNNYLDRIPVQVKTETVSKFSNNSKYKNFNKADFENYWKDDGVLIFVVEIDKMNKEKIFVTSLFPSDITQKLKEISQKGKNSASIKLDYLPTYNNGIIENICNNFLLQRKNNVLLRILNPLLLLKLMIW
jgi:hypothetical protein